MVVVAICCSINIDITVAISIPITDISVHVPLINTVHGGVVPVIWRSSSSWVWGVSFVCLPVGFGEPGNKKVGKNDNRS